MIRTLGYFALGGLIGAGVGLLFAPRPGEETRALISKDIEDALNQAEDFGEQTAEGVWQVYEAASKETERAIGEVEPVFQEKTDEIREHIENARARITAGKK